MADSITDFWKRWHISLSSWFRDYVYIPLGGNRVGKIKHIRNLFLVWVLTGIWHGANWTFLVWGLAYFIFLMLEKYTGLNRLPKVFRQMYTMMIVIIAWVIFRADNITIALQYIRNMFSVNVYASVEGLQYYVKNTWIVLLFSLVGIFPFYIKIEKWIMKRKLFIIKYVWLSIVFFFHLLQ